MKLRQLLPKTGWIGIDNCLGLSPLSSIWVAVYLHCNVKMVPLLYHSEGHSKYQQHKCGQLVKNVLLAVLNQTWISQCFSSEHLPFAICIQSPFPSARAYRASRIKDHRKSVTLGANWQPVPERSHRTVVFDIFCHYIIPKPREIGQWTFQFMTGSSTTAQSIMHQNHYSN